MSTGMIIVISICIGVIGGVVGFFVLRGMKGTIKLDCEKSTFDPGETITGNVHVKIKKQTIGNKLKIS